MKNISPKSYLRIKQNIKEFDLILKKEYEKLTKQTFKKFKKTAHIVYPFDLNKKINPWSIGNNLYLALKEKYNIKIYNWTSIQKIFPNKGDILMGHPHTNPLTVFRRSLSNKNWSKK